MRHLYQENMMMTNHQTFHILGFNRNIYNHQLSKLSHSFRRTHFIHTSNNPIMNPSMLPALFSSSCDTFVLGRAGWIFLWANGFALPYLFPSSVVDDNMLGIVAKLWSRLGSKAMAMDGSTALCAVLVVDPMELRRVVSSRLDSNWGLDGRFVRS